MTIHANLDIEYNVLIIGKRKDYHAVKSWKGTERLKTKGEIECNGIDDCVSGLRCGFKP